MQKDNPELVRARAMLSPVYEIYVNTVSSWKMALSLETAALAWVLCEQIKPRRIIDMGSGFSSFVVRHWAKSSGSDADVWSTDDDKLWLDQSALFCAKTGVSVANFVHWDDFNITEQFDLIIYDLGRMPCRTTNIERAFSLRSPNGVIVIDDMHKFNYNIEVKRVIQKFNLNGVDMKDATIDRHEGRHCWLAL